MSQCKFLYTSFQRNQDLFKASKLHPTPTVDHLNNRIPPDPGHDLPIPLQDLALGISTINPADHDPGVAPVEHADGAGVERVGGGILEDHPLLPALGGGRVGGLVRPGLCAAVCFALEVLLRLQATRGIRFEPYRGEQVGQQVGGFVVVLHGCWVGGVAGISFIQVFTQSEEFPC